MKVLFIGNTHFGGVPILIQELPPDLQALQSKNAFDLEVLVGDNQGKATLAELRRLRKLIQDAEQRLLLREEQAARAQNMNLDLG